MPGGRARHGEPTGRSATTMTPANTARAGQTKKRTRIQEENEERILDAALEIFSSYGFRGATVDQIAELAGMTKAEPALLFPPQGRHLPRHSAPDAGALAAAAGVAWRRRRPGHRDPRLYRPQAGDLARQPEGVAALRHGNPAGRAGDGDHFEQPAEDAGRQQGGGDPALDRRKAAWRRSIPTIFCS